ncbi:MAG: carboxylesterase, partial [Burkholderiales bacterium]|nr:carboxylesterase [Burkholderiales bacterium]
VPAERSAANLKTPILIAHGKHDGVVPILRAQQTRDYLSALGYVIEWHEYAMEHTLIDQEIDDISAWLCKIFAPTTAK